VICFVKNKSLLFIVLIYIFLLQFFVKLQYHKQQLQRSSGSSGLGAGSSSVEPTNHSAELLDEKDLQRTAMNSSSSMVWFSFFYLLVLR